MLAKFTLVGLVLFAFGYWLTDRLYKHKNQKLRGSSVETKIIMWIPIYLLTILFAISNTLIQVVFVVWVLANCWHELIIRNKVRWQQWQFYLYVILVSLGVASAIGIIRHSQSLFLAAWLMSVLSDVKAYFAGNFLGKHYLPASLNNKKSFEGVAGQLIGAGLGFVLVDTFITSIPTYLIVTVGVGSAIGDLTNSYFKRSINIKEWSNNIPGHGGYLDRFSSLSFALLLTYIVLTLFR